MLFIDMNNLINRYYYTKKYKNENEFFNIIKTSLNNLQTKYNLKKEETFLCFDPKDIKDKSWRYNYIKDYKNNKLQSILYSIKENLAFERNPEIIQMFSEINKEIIIVKEENINKLLKKWNIKEQITITTYSKFIEDIDTIINKNIKTKKEQENKKNILKSLLNIENISEIINELKFHIVNNNEDILNEYFKFFKAKYVIDIKEKIEKYDINYEYLNDYRNILNIINSKNEKEVEKVLVEQGYEVFIEDILNNIKTDNVEYTIEYLYEEFMKEGYNVKRIPKLEADDIIFQLAKVYNDKLNYVYSNDQDLQQLIYKFPQVKIIDKEDITKELSKKEFLKKLILGDKSDNIKSITSLTPIKIQFGEKNFEKNYKEEFTLKDIITLIKEKSIEKLKKLDNKIVINDFDNELINIRKFINNLLIDFENIPNKYKNSLIIDRFKKEYGFLSNMSKCNIEYDNIIYPTVEHFYVAMKVDKNDIIDINGNSINTRKYISTIKEPVEVKKLHQNLKLRDNWNDIKLKVMEYGIEQKFNTKFYKEKLLNTKDKYLVEGNYWNDTYWGVCNGKGENNLGKLLMNKRKKLQKELEMKDKNIKIKTSYYPMLKKLKENDKVETVSISLKLLDFIDKELIDQHVTSLAPAKEIFFDYKKTVKTDSKKAEKEYVKNFNLQLEKMDFEEEIKNIIKTAKNKNKNEIVLLCYEGPEDFCHRHIVAQKINEIADKLGIEPVKEFEHEEIDFSKEYKLPTTIDKQLDKYYLMITGHANIEKAFGVNIKPEDSKYYDETVYDTVKKEIELFIKKQFMRDKNIKDIKDIVFISGMARGVDEIFLDIAEENNCDVILSIPNSIAWHQNRPPRKDGTVGQALIYQKHLEYARNRANSYIFEVRKKYNGKSYTYANFARNAHMVDLADEVISYKRDKSPGTENAIKVAKEKGKYYGNIPDYNMLDKELKPGLNILYNSDFFKEKFNVGIHGANCFNTFGAGIAAVIKEKFPKVYEVDQETTKGDRNKLGTFTYADVRDIKDGNMQFLVSLYSQYTYWDQKDMFDIKAFKKGMKDIIKHFIEKRNSNGKQHIPIKFGFPAIGLGLANGKAEEIYKELKKLEKVFKKDNIIMMLCLHPKDKELQNSFKKLENEFKYRSKNNDIDR